MSLFTKLVYTFSCIAIAAGSADDYGLGMIINYDGDIDSSTISDGLKAPNATGRIPISGPNVTEVYPGTMIDGDGDQNGWELSIDVTANVPITDGSKAGRFISAAGLKLLPPAELVQDFGNGTEILKADRDSWVTCFTVFGMDGVSSPITSECTANIQRAVANDQRIIVPGCYNLGSYEHDPWGSFRGSCSGRPCTSRDDYAGQ
ncbi:hypothetical protein TruAng_004312 [Truncatella angustata]|nr:hypothetical protein TruAng_004312 [Truncatella angustata]